MIDYERRVDEDMLAERNRKKIEHGSKPYYRRTPPEQLEAMYRERAWHRAQNEARNVRAKAKKAAIEAAKKEEAIAFRLYMMNERKRAAAEADLPAQVAKKVCFDLTERKTSAAVANLCTDTTDIAAEPVPAFIPTTSQGGRIYGFDHDQWALHDELGLDDEGALLTAAQKARYVAHLKQVEDKMRKKASDATSSTRHGTEAPSDPSPIVQGRDRGDKSPSSTRPGTYALNYDDFSSDSESDDESQPINNVASNLQMGTAVGRTLAENNNTTSSSTDKRLARATESKQYSSATNGGSYTPAAKQIEVPDSVSPHITPFIRKPPTRLPVARPYTQLHPLANEIGRDIAANKSNAPSQQISADNSLRQNAGAKDITTHSHRIIEATSTTKDKAASSEPVKAAAMQTVVGQDGLSQSASGRKAAINFNKRPKATTKQTSVGNDKTENYGDTVQSRLGHDITNNVFAAMLDEAGIANPIDGADLLTPSAVAVTGYNPARNNYGHDIPDGVFAAMLEEAGIADVLKRADSSAVYSRGSYGPGPLADSANGDMGLMLKESGIEVEL